MSDEGREDPARSKVECFDNEGLSQSLLGELMAVLAHDFRNPLAALCSNLEYLNSSCGSIGRDASEAIDDGLVSCDGLTHLASNLDLLGQALRRERPGAERPMRLRPLVMAAVESCRGTAASHGLQLEVSPTMHEHDTVVVVPRMAATSAIANLIRNSIQHSVAGSTVQMSIRQQSGRGIVVVSDEGQALLAEHEQAFTAAGQVDQADTRSHFRYSRGLGLFCARLGALACGAELQTVPPSSVVHEHSDRGRVRNVFELRFPRA